MHPLSSVNMIVKRLFLGLVAFGVCAGSNEPSAKLLSEIESRYNRARTLQVRFSETYTAAGRAARTESGVLYLRKPGRMRWEYATPKGKLFISDGKDIFLYLPDSNRVEKMTLKGTEDLRAPLAFLLGKLNFNKEFQNIQARAAGPGATITAEPKSAALPYSKVEFQVSPQYEIRKLHVTGQDGSVLDFTFDGERLNPTLADQLFRFTAPAGCEVVEGSR